MRGVVLAGGKGTRLGELTRVTNKHLLPVGPYPMIYYPIKKLVGAGVREIMLVSGSDHVGDFVELLRSGWDHGCSITYRVQEEAGGIAQALGLAEGFCAGDGCVVVLGDNIFYDPINRAMVEDGGCRDSAGIHLSLTREPSKFGVAEVDGPRVVGIEEKPAHPKSNFAVTGLYFYPPSVFSVIKELKPSERGELEITDVNNFYLRSKKLWYNELRGYWTDAGTPESYAEANRLVREQPPRY